MYIINEEEHLQLAICKDFYKAPEWLLNNDWLSAKSEMIFCDDHGEEIFLPLWKRMNLNSAEDATPLEICHYFFRMNQKQFFEEMEALGFHFNEIEVIDY